MSDFKQRDATDCGACCLAFIAKHYGRRLSVAQIRQWSGTGPQGTTALGLIESAGRIGLTAKGVKGEADALSSIPLPAIAHCLIDGRHLHFVVLTRWSERRIEIMDPAFGQVERWSREQFIAAWSGVMILLAPSDAVIATETVRSPWLKFVHLLLPHRGLVIQAIAGALVATALGVAMSIYVEQIVDRVVPHADRRLLNLLGLGMGAVLLFKLILNWLQGLISITLAQRIDAALMLAYFRHLLRLPQPFFDTMRVGEITSRVSDAARIRHFLNSTLLSLLLNPLILGFALTFMVFTSWKLALISLALLPLNAAIYWLVDLGNRRCQRNLMERGAEFAAHLVESLNAQPLIRRFLLETHIVLQAETKLVRLLRAVRRSALLGQGSNILTTLITQAYLIWMLWMGAGLVIDAELTPGQLMSCYTLATYLSEPFAALIGLNTSVRESLVAADRLFEIMDLEREKDEGTIEFGSRHVDDLHFERITFKHPGRLATIRDFTLTIPKGKITALAGEPGCGKSTLLSLIQRLYLIDEGRILIGAHDLRYFRLDSLRRHLAVMPQQVHFFPGTILANIAVGVSEPDSERVLTLCRELGALEFIEKLPQGILTHLTENGANLSGGQRQRLALVRALYLDAPILLLDEPSSALDAASERRLIALLQRQRDEAGKTIVIAAHSKSIAAAADLVVELKLSGAS
ncbi:MAG TPA: peptidase domain-containing ABC transporter [Opitutaceae bacterium]